MTAAEFARAVEIALDNAGIAATVEDIRTVEAVQGYGHLPQTIIAKMEVTVYAFRKKEKKENG